MPPLLLQVLRVLQPDRAAQQGMGDAECLLRRGGIKIE
jgi:hypothetical protein